MYTARLLTVTGGACMAGAMCDMGSMCGGGGGCVAREACVMGSVWQGGMHWGSAWQRGMGVYHMTYPIMHLMLPVCYLYTNWKAAPMQMLIYFWLVMWPVQGKLHAGITPPPPRGQADACKNITFPQLLKWRCNSLLFKTEICIISCPIQRSICCMFITDEKWQRLPETFKKGKLNITLYEYLASRWIIVVVIKFRILIDGKKIDQWLSEIKTMDVRSCYIFT